MRLNSDEFHLFKTSLIEGLEANDTLGKVEV
jgi:hypothetical protein